MFNWEEYFNLAKELAIKLPGGNQEACFRASISRAYYAAFNKARKYAESTNKPLLDQIKNNNPNIGIHVAVQKCLSLDTNNNVKKAAIKLGTVKKDRIKCDYDDVVISIDFICQKALIGAEDIIRLIP